MAGSIGCHDVSMKFGGDVAELSWSNHITAFPIEGVNDKTIKLLYTKRLFDFLESLMLCILVYCLYLQ